MKNKTIARAAAALAAALLLAALAAFAASCTAKKPRAEDLLGTSFDRVLEVTTERGTCTVRITAEGGNAALELLAPESLAGVVFTAKDGRFYASAGGVLAEISKDSIPGGSALFDAFSPPAGAELQRSFRRENGEKVTVCTLVSESGNVLYYFDGNGELLRVEREGGDAFTAVVRRNESAPAANE